MRSLVHRLLKASALVLISSIGFSSVFAASSPTYVAAPTNEQDGGLFSYYFRNLFKDFCQEDYAVTDITNAGILICSTIVEFEKDPKVGTLTKDHVPKWSTISLINSQIVDDGTNVGIGITNPSKKLEVNGAIRSNNIAGGSALEGGEFILGGASPVYLDIYDSRFRVHGGGSERFTIDTSGNVGIGAIPIQRMTVNGGGYFNGRLTANNLLSRNNATAVGHADVGTLTDRSTAAIGWNLTVNASAVVNGTTRANEWFILPVVSDDPSSTTRGQLWLIDGVSAAVAVNGSCGSAARNYPNGSTGYGSDRQCSVGNPSNSAFPPAGGSVSWTCSGVNGGATSGTCTATQANTSPQAGVCGPAATNYTATQTSYAGAYCSTGNPSTTPAFPAQGSSSSWTCDGTGGGPSSATCTATRAAPAAVTECNDGIDNDNNGGTDLADVDCSSASDDSELGAYDCSELADAGEVYCSAVSNKAYCETTQPSPPRAACRCTTGTKTVVWSETVNGVTDTYYACSGTAANTPIIENFSYTDDTKDKTVAPNTTLALKWSSRGATSCRINSSTGYPTSSTNTEANAPSTAGTYTWTLVCTSAAGDSAPQTVTVRVVAATCGWNAGGYHQSAPTSDLCGSGNTASTVTESGGKYNWSCRVDTTSVNCSSTKIGPGWCRDQDPNYAPGTCTTYGSPAFCTNNATTSSCRCSPDSAPTLMGSWQGYTYRQCGGTTPPPGGTSYTYSWYTGSYSSCSATACGTTGTETRSVTCRRSDGVDVADSFCSGAGTKPSASQSCNAVACPPGGGASQDVACMRQVHIKSYFDRQGGGTSNVELKEFDSTIDLRQAAGVTVLAAVSSADNNCWAAMEWNDHLISCNGSQDSAATSYSLRHHTNWSIMDLTSAYTKHERGWDGDADVEYMAVETWTKDGNTLGTAPQCTTKACWSARLSWWGGEESCFDSVTTNTHGSTARVSKQRYGGCGETNVGNAQFRCENGTWTFVSGSCTFSPDPCNR